MQVAQGRSGHHETTKNNGVGVFDNRHTAAAASRAGPKAASSTPSSSRNASRKYKLTAKVLIGMN